MREGDGGGEGGGQSDPCQVDSMAYLYYCMCFGPHGPRLHYVQI